MADEQKIGKFQILGPLGKGAHSSILHIRRQSDGKQYALKVVSIGEPEEKKFLDQAEHEFAVSQKLNHPNLIKIHALEIQKDWLFRPKKAHLLIDFVNGKTLDEVPPLSLPKLVLVFSQIAAGLAHMHRRGIWHADMKPNNVMLSRSGEVKIIDYGLAWIKGDAKDRVQGTPEYMAPETGKHKLINDRTDIFNLGATMYKLACFRNIPRTFAAKDEMDIDGEIWESRLKPVKECNAAAPADLAALIHRCLSFNAMKRPERMSDVQSELESIANRLCEGSDSHKMLEW
ncbi:MAG: serine/threonine-protein kinase [Gemmataceae bacterium]